MNNIFLINRPTPQNNIFNFINLLNSAVERPQHDILTRSFNDQGGSTHPTDEKVVENLEQIEFTEDQEISCGICLESFKKGDKALLLPCKDNKHYFHLGEDKESCCGILPWLKENNTCPICREVFPEKKDIVENVEEENNDESDSIDNVLDDDSDNNVNNILDDVERFLESIIQRETSDEEEYSEVLSEEEVENNSISEFLGGINEYMQDEEDDDDRVNETAENIANMITNSIMNDFNRRNMINRGPFINIVMNPPRQVYDEDHELQLAIQRSLEER